MLGIIDFILLMLFGPILMAYLWCRVMHAKFVRGAYGRYVWTNWCIISLSLLIFVSTSLGVVEAVLNQPVWAAVWISVSLMYARHYRDLYDEDNWFKHQGQKIKRFIERTKPQFGNVPATSH